jgi:hypothetical protein
MVDKVGNAWVMEWVRQRTVDANSDSLGHLAKVMTVNHQGDGLGE